jgi:hypothetical protein
MQTQEKGTRFNQKRKERRKIFDEKGIFLSSSFTPPPYLLYPLSPRASSHSQYFSTWNFVCYRAKDDIEMGEKI